MTETELAWAAGIIEGEGSIRIAKFYQHDKTGYRRFGDLQVKLVMTDRKVVDFFIERWPASHGHAAGRSDRHHETWWWQIGRGPAARFLEDVLPYLRTERMRTKTILGLAFQRQKVAGGVENRTDVYRARQQFYIDVMRDLNRRGPVAV